MYNLIAKDSFLSQYYSDIEYRVNHYLETKKRLLGSTYRNLSDFANAHHYFGFHQDEVGNWFYREWAPAAHRLFLIGDFNNWDRNSHPLNRMNSGNWEIKLPPSALHHGSRVKVHVVGNDNVGRDRIPIYIHRAVQDFHTGDFTGEVWMPEKSFEWSDQNFKVNLESPVLIYEAHTGMAQVAGSIGAYRQFADYILPRIKNGGYNTVQLMAVMEHPYYGSFGYQVSNFFAVSSRFGTPDDLKYLINEAHKIGLAVWMDVVHSHAVKNVAEGINLFDGTEYQFFHAGAKGDNAAWDSKNFDFSKPEIIHMMLSNLKYWLEEYHFDGFRFDGVTSMLYHNRGLESFTTMDQYFSMNTDTDAVTYLQLANELIKEIKPWALTSAEDMSGMPGIALPVSDGSGIGFDYRLAMGLPDYWIHIFKSGKRDQDWDLDELWYRLTDRRNEEKNIAYVESHDQALVGDKTMSHWLMDKEIYYHMGKDDSNMVVERGMALHKLIRLVTILLGGEAWLNFIGNEFGHPEWVDFPTSRNNWSYHYARRQWNLVDSPDLKYQFLNNFDQAMIALIKEFKLLPMTELYRYWSDNENKILVFRKGSLIFIFNFNPERSFPSYFLPTHETGKFAVVLSTDSREFGGHGRADEEYIYNTRVNQENMSGFDVYSPARTAIAFKKI